MIKYIAPNHARATTARAVKESAYILLPAPTGYASPCTILSEPVTDITTLGGPYLFAKGWVERVLGTALLPQGSLFRWDAHVSEFDVTPLVYGPAGRFPDCRGKQSLWVRCIFFTGTLASTFASALALARYGNGEPDIYGGHSHEDPNCYSCCDALQFKRTTDPFFNVGSRVACEYRCQCFPHWEKTLHGSFSYALGTGDDDEELGGYFAEVRRITYYPDATLLTFDAGVLCMLAFDGVFSLSTTGGAVSLPVDPTSTLAALRSIALPSYIKPGAQFRLGCGLYSPGEYFIQFSVSGNALFTGSEARAVLLVDEWGRGGGIRLNAPGSGYKQKTTTAHVVEPPLIPNRHCRLKLSIVDGSVVSIRLRNLGGDYTVLATPHGRTVITSPPLPLCTRYPQPCPVRIVWLRRASEDSVNHDRLMREMRSVPLLVCGGTEAAAAPDLLGPAARVNPSRQTSGCRALAPLEPWHTGDAKHLKSVLGTDGFTAHFNNVFCYHTKTDLSTIDVRCLPSHLRYPLLFPRTKVAPLSCCPPPTRPPSLYPPPSHPSLVHARAVHLHHADGGGVQPQGCGGAHYQRAEGLGS